MSTVVWKTLGEVCEICRGASPRPIQRYITEDTSAVNWIKIGDVSAESKYIVQAKEKITKEGASKSRFLEKGAFILSNSMSFGRPYILGIDGCIHDGWIAINNYQNNLVADYLYEILKSKRVQLYWKARSNNGGAMSNLNSDIVKETVIPVPCIIKQAEIANQLNTFTTLISRLESELELRQKQYEHYREVLLNFDGDEEVEWKTIGSICNIMNGKDYKKERTGDIPVYGSGGILTYIDKAMSEKPSVLLPRKGSLNNVFYVDTPFWTVDTIYWTEIGNEVIPKYFFYYMTTINLEAMNIATGAVPSMTKSILNRIEVPVPSKHRQQQIVSQLDTFEQLITALKREIALRKKQYEYYREKLLTFDE